MQNRLRLAIVVAVSFGLIAAYGIYNFNWGCYLESLRLYCETGTGKPFQAP